MGWRDAPEVTASRWESAPEVEAPGALESGLWGGLQGVSLGFSDEMEAFAGALANKVTGGEFDYGDRRTQARERYASAEQANPTAYRVGEVGGGVAGALLPGGALAKAGGLGRALATGAAVGGAAGLGSSEADLTEGDVGGALQDTAAGAGVGAAGGAVGRGLGKVAQSVGNRIAGRAAPRVAAADAKIGQMAQEQAGEEVADLGRKLGAQVQKGSRLVENLDRVGGRLDPADAANLRALTPERLALEKRVAQGNLRDLPGQVGAINTAEAALQQAQQNSPARVAELVASIGNPANQVMPRLQRYLPPVVGDLVGGAAGQSAAGALGRGAVGAGLGLATGGDTTSAATGALAGVGMRPAFQAILRGVRHPSVQRSVWGAIQQIATSVPGALGRYGPLLGRVAATNMDEAFRLHSALLASDEEYARKVAGALQRAHETEAPDAGMEVQ